MTWAPEGNRRRGRPKTTWRRTVEKENKGMEDRNHAWDGPKQLTENSGKTPCRSYVARVTKGIGVVPQVVL